MCSDLALFLNGYTKKKKVYRNAKNSNQSHAQGTSGDGTSAVYSQPAIVFSAESQVTYTHHSTALRTGFPGPTNSRIQGISIAERLHLKQTGQSCFSSRLS